MNERSDSRGHSAARAAQPRRQQNSRLTVTFQSEQGGDRSLSRSKLSQPRPVHAARLWEIEHTNTSSFAAEGVGPGGALMSGHDASCLASFPLLECCYPLFVAQSRTDDDDGVAGGPDDLNDLIQIQGSGQGGKGDIVGACSLGDGSQGIKALYPASHFSVELEVCEDVVALGHVHRRVLGGCDVVLLLARGQRVQDPVILLKTSLPELLSVVDQDLHAHPRFPPDFPHGLKRRLEQFLPGSVLGPTHPEGNHGDDARFHVAHACGVGQ
mmetsp:Transcript_31/g.79  ORF Transcript_31/g.79 Transcript_31/m.79 type:complete len:269 (-) Transcript_31:236-1042(-)